MTTFSVSPPFLKQQTTQDVEGVLPPWLYPRGALEPLEDKVRSRFNTEVAIPNGLTVVYDNAPAAIPSPGTLWAANRVTFTQAELLAVGGPTMLQRRHGQMTTDIFVPLVEGDAAGLNLADDINVAFREVAANGVTYLQPETRTTGRVSRNGGAWWLVESRVPFYLDVVITPRKGAAWANLDAEAAHNICRARFKAQIADLEPLLTVYDNSPDVKPDPGTQWCRFSVALGAKRRITLSDSEILRTRGAATAQLFAPLMSGTSVIMAVADAVMEEFQYLADGGVKFEGAVVEQIGRAGDFWQVNVRVPFSFDELAP